MGEGAASRSKEAALTTAQPVSKTEINASRGFAAWLQSHDLSLAFTSYQTGQLFLVGRLPNGSISFNQQNFSRVMGLFAQPGRLYVGSLFQIWRLENMLRPGELGNQAFDAVLVPRNAQTTGDVDVHELGVDGKGRVIFVNTRYSCLATLDTRFAFKPIWKPRFISKLAAEDRCHLNGLAMSGGEPRYVTAVSQTDVVDGWRAKRDSGGVLIEVPTDRIVADNLSMPHSPRIKGDHVYLLESGRGQIVRVDPATGAREDIAFCPGFLRGLAIHDDHAIVTVSKPRDGSFKELALQREIERRDGEPWCGVLIVDLKRGDIVEWVRLEGEIAELFDVAAMPGVRCPMSVGVGTLEMQSSIAFDDMP
jgi:uncharacterized protein (TIGR03032 family)